MRASKGLAALLAVAGFILRPAGARAADGDLDPTFGLAGTLTTSFGPGRQDQAAAVTAQPDGKVLLAGQSYNGTGYEVALARYTELGALDPTFGVEGKVTTMPGFGAVARAIALQPDGSIVVAGGTENPYRFLVLRYTPDGTLDPSFGAGGIVVTTFGAGYDGQAAGVAIQADGKIVAAGTIGHAVGGTRKNEFALARYETDGTLDATFGAGGLVLTSFGPFTNPGDVATAMAIAPDGRIAVGGYTNLGDGLHFALARYLPNGALDPLFGGGGIYDVYPGRVIGVPAGQWAYALAVPPDGRVLLAGGGRSGRFAVARFTFVGGPDPTFGPAHNGFVTTALEPAISADDARAMAVTADGKIVAAGLTHNGVNYDYGLVRYTAAGDLDPGFGVGGIVKTGIVPEAGIFVGGDAAQALALTPDGRIVVGGYSQGDGASVFSAARYLGNGPPPTDPRADLSLAMAASSTDPLVGTDVTFTITVHNAGPAEATGVRAHAILPDELAFQSSPGAMFDPLKGFVWNLGSVPSGGSRAVTLVARAVAGSPGAPVYAAVLSSDAPDPDSVPGNGIPGEDDEAVIVVAPRALTPADLSLSLASDNAAPPIGVDTRLTLTIANAGPGAAPGVAAQVVLPAELALVAAPAAYDAVTRTWTVGTVAAGGSASLELVVRRTVNVPVSVFAEVSASGVPDPDSFAGNGPNLEDDDATVLLAPARADLSLELEARVTQPVPGIHARLLVTAVNDGPADVSDVRVLFTLPAGLTFVSADQPVVVAGNVQWTVAALPSGSRETLTLIVRPERAGAFAAVAEVLAATGAADPDSRPGNHDPAEDDQKTVTIAVAAAVGDADGDGLPDDWEINGIDVDGDGVVDLALNLPPFNARPGHKDVFVELDWMVGAPPDPGALADVVAAFAAAPVPNPDGATGIDLHILADEALPDMPFLDFLGGGADSFDRVKLGDPAVPCDGSFGTAAERLGPSCASVLAARRLAVHYAIYAHQLAGGGASGIAERPGNDFAITLADWSAAALAAAGGRRAVEAGVFMHELGHNLGLRHGGADDVNCKPNYLSAMNYTLTTREIDPARPLDYSRAALPALDENALSEPAGVGGPAGRSVVYAAAGATRLAPAMGPIDWNGDGLSGGVDVSADINAVAGLCGPGLEVLEGYDDWANLLYDFRGSPDFAEGPRVTPHVEAELTEPQVIAVAAAIDRTPVARDDAYTTRKNRAFFIAAPGVLANDVAPDRSRLTATLVTGPAHGLLLLFPNGSFAYLPKPGFVGKVTFTYRASDGLHASNPATVTITVAKRKDHDGDGDDDHEGRRR